MIKYAAEIENSIFFKAKKIKEKWRKNNREENKKQNVVERKNNFCIEGERKN